MWAFPCHNGAALKANSADDEERFGALLQQEVAKVVGLATQMVLDPWVEFAARKGEGFEEEMEDSFDGPVEDPFLWDSVAKPGRLESESDWQVTEEEMLSILRMEQHDALRNVKIDVADMDESAMIEDMLKVEEHAVSATQNDTSPKGKGKGKGQGKGKEVVVEGIHKTTMVHDILRVEEDVERNVAVEEALLRNVSGEGVQENVKAKKDKGKGKGKGKEVVSDEMGESAMIEDLLRGEEDVVAVVAGEELDGQGRVRSGSPRVVRHTSGAEDGMKGQELEQGFMLEEDGGHLMRIEDVYLFADDVSEDGDLCADARPKSDAWTGSVQQDVVRDASAAGENVMDDASAQETPTRNVSFEEDKRRHVTVSRDLRAAGRDERSPTGARMESSPMGRCMGREESSPQRATMGRPPMGTGMSRQESSSMGTVMSRQDSSPMGTVMSRQDSSPMGTVTSRQRCSPMGALIGAPGDAESPRFGREESWTMERGPHAPYPSMIRPESSIFGRENTSMSETGPHAPHPSMIRQESSMFGPEESPTLDGGRQAPHPSMINSPHRSPREGDAQLWTQMIGPRLDDWRFVRTRRQREPRQGRCPGIGDRLTQGLQAPQVTLVDPCQCNAEGFVALLRADSTFSGKIVVRRVTKDGHSGRLPLGLGPFH